MIKKTYDTFAVSKHSPLLNEYLDGGHQEEFMENMDAFVYQVKECNSKQDLVQLETLDTSCNDCLIVKGW